MNTTRHETRSSLRPFRRAGTIGMLALTLSGAGCGSHEAQQTYVDCAKEPLGTATVRMDTAQRAMVYLGNAFIKTDGTVVWRDRLELDTNADGTLALIADGFGPVETYDDIARSGGWSMYNNETHSGLATSVQEPNPSGGMQSLPPGVALVTYQCTGQPGGQPSPTPSTSPTPSGTPA